MIGRTMTGQARTMGGQHPSPCCTYPDGHGQPSIEAVRLSGSAVAFALKMTGDRLLMAGDSDSLGRCFVARITGMMISLLRSEGSRATGSTPVTRISRRSNWLRGAGLVEMVISVSSSPKRASGLKRKQESLTRNCGSLLGGGLCGEHRPRKLLRQRNFQS